MTDDQFDADLVGAAFALGAADGWRKVSAASAARSAGLDLAEARRRFPSGAAILKRFGALADEYALAGAAKEGSVRDRLFDLLLRRFDFLQQHRGGVLALSRFTPMQPALGVFLACETQRSMAWLLEAAGVSASGIRGGLRTHGLGAVWGWGLRAWIRDESEDLSATMAAVDVALNRADQLASRFGGSADPEGFTPETAEAPLAPEPGTTGSMTPEPAAPEPGAPEPAAPQPGAPEPELPLGGIDDPMPPGVPPAGMPGI